MTPLTAQNVENIFRACLAKDGEIPEDQIAAFVEGGKCPDGWQVSPGVLVKAMLNSKRLSEHTAEISEMLSQLPDQFQADKGGGWSFLNACMTKAGAQWGEHRSIDQLICLGSAVGLVAIQFPKEMWGALPGGMPYFVVKQSPNQTVDTFPNL